MVAFRRNALRLQNGTVLTLTDTHALEFTRPPTGNTWFKIKDDFGAIEVGQSPDPVTNKGGFDLTLVVQNGPAVYAIYSGSGAIDAVFNFGATAFNAAPPAGFSAWGAGTTLDPTKVSAAYWTLADGNLKGISQGFGGYGGNNPTTTSHTGGKWYFEAQLTFVTVGSDASGIGVTSVPVSLPGGGVFSCGPPQLSLGTSGTFTNFNQPLDQLANPVQTNDIWGFAIDLDNKSMWFRLNGGAWLGNNGGAFTKFKYNTINLPQQFLDLQGGTYNIGINALAEFFLDGLKKAVIWGYGAKFQGVQNTDLVPKIGSASGFENQQQTPVTGFLTAAQAGSYFVTFLTPSDVNHYAVGDWCWLGALELQGHAGFPPNHQFGEYVQIVSISGATVGLSLPIKGTHYKTTYPNHDVGDLYNPGGPVALFKMTAGEWFLINNPITPGSWDSDQELFGITFELPIAIAGTEIQGANRSLEYTGCDFVNCVPSPTGSKRVIWRYCHTDVNSGQIEMDKEMELVEFNNCRLRSCTAQSASLQNFTIQDTTFEAQIAGTGQNQIIQNVTTSNLSLGCIGFGQAKTATLKNVTSNLCGGVRNIIFIDPAWYANGTFTLPAAIYNQLAPGLAFYGGFARTFALAFNVLDVINSNPIIVPTDCTLPTLPTLPLICGAPVIQFSACAQIFCSNSTSGDHVLDDLSLPQSQGLPIFSYSNRTFAGNLGTVIGGGGISYVQLGQLTQVTINVTQPYTGAQSSAPLTYLLGVLDPGFNAVFCTAVINLKQAGIRTITASGITGAKSGDDFSGVPAGQLTVLDSVNLFCSTDMSGDTPPQQPIVNIITQTNQLSTFS